MGHAVAQAVLHAPDCVTVSIRENPETVVTAGNDWQQNFDWRATLGSMSPDGPLKCEFGDHTAAVQSAKVFVSGTVAAIACGMIAYATL